MRFSELNMDMHNIAKPESQNKSDVPKEQAKENEDYECETELSYKPGKYAKQTRSVHGESDSKKLPPSVKYKYENESKRNTGREFESKDTKKELKPPSHPRQNTKCLTIENLGELTNRDPQSILLRLSQRNSGFVRILNQPELLVSDVCLIIKLLAKSCSNQTQSKEIIKLLLDVDTSLFMSLTIPSVLAKLSSEVSDQTVQTLIELIADILDFLTELSIRMPHAIIQISGVLSLVETSLSSVERCGMTVPNAVVMKTKQVIDTKASILKRMQTDRLKANKKVKLPDDFRTISIMPTYDDVFPTKPPLIRKIKATGRYSDVNDYLDVQFRLLHEDFIQPLRQGIREYLIALDNPRQYVSVRIYNNVVIRKQEFIKEKFVHTLTFDISKLKHVQWAYSKRLKYGTLVCLSSNNFKTFSVATVESEPEIKEQGTKEKEQGTKEKEQIITVDICIQQVIGERRISMAKPMVMLETPAYFEAYRHVLASLQNIKDGQLPFEDYIVHCKTDVKPPAYLRDKPNVKYNFGLQTHKCKIAKERTIHGSSLKTVLSGEIRNNRDENVVSVQSKNVVDDGDLNLVSGEIKHISDDSGLNDQHNGSGDQNMASGYKHRYDCDDDGISNDNMSNTCVCGSDHSDRTCSSLSQSEDQNETKVDKTEIHEREMSYGFDQQCTSTLKVSNWLLMDDTHVKTFELPPTNDHYKTADDVTSVLQLDTWPQPECLNLDVTQFKAFQQALTKEFVIMQGPPGTGKTYVGIETHKSKRSEERKIHGSSLKTVLSDEIRNNSDENVVSHQSKNVINDVDLNLLSGEIQNIGDDDRENDQTNDSGDLNLASGYKHRYDCDDDDDDDDDDEDDISNGNLSNKGVCGSDHTHRRWCNLSQSEDQNDTKVDKIERPERKISYGFHDQRTSTLKVSNWLVMDETHVKTCEHPIANDRYKTVDVTSVLELDTWPQPEDLNLDVTQFKAFQQALTKEFVIMQGPPGTGKTYVGLKIVKTLLSNAAVWQSDSRPMLIICYTNHALDQFLEGILSFHNGDLVRVGSQCKNQKVKQYDIKRMQIILNIPAMYSDTLLDDYVKCQRSVIESQKHLEMLHDGIVKTTYLKTFIKKSHYDQLTQTVFADWTLLVWLDLLVAMHVSTEKKQYAFKGGTKIFEDKQTQLNDQSAKNKCEETCDELTSSRGIIMLHFRMILSEISQKYHSYVGNQIHSSSRMTEEEAMSVKDIWSLQNYRRWRLYRFWIGEMEEHLEKEFTKVQEQCVHTGEQYRIARLKTDKAVMKRCSVIGMTTTAAARYQKVLSEIKPRIIVIEEAAEILEGHVIASLSSECQHLILIGDHQQLRPSTNVYTLAKRYNLELSLFERMVKNGMHCICLTKQHRMRPSISRIVKHIYPDLRDDASVQDYPNILGVSSNVFFISHSEPEEKNEELISHLNIFEAKYVIALCLYLIKQGYSPCRITILTTYSAQVAYLKRNMTNETFHGVRVTDVDNYQGEENDIILLSLVRSNLEGNVGFLKIDNRVCVALSRAKQGLYVIGNFELLSKQSDLWKNIIDDLKSASQVGNALGLYCQNHPSETGIKASKAEDLLLAPEGGCMKDCLFQLKCGHVCASRCHPVDLHHLQYKCQKPCEKILCDLQHQCPKLCFEHCQKCVVLVTKVIPSCRHEQEVPCSLEPRYFDCRRVVLHKMNCGHVAKMYCFMRGRATCKAKCDAVLKCGHNCSGLCHECVQGRLHVACTKACNKSLICGHECQSVCSSCPPCQLPCENKCAHRTCDKRCGEMCTPCNEPCIWICENKKCNKKCTNICSDVCNRTRCNNRCPRKLECGHRCIGLCGEKCPALCKVCNEDEVSKCQDDLKNKLCIPFVELDDCGHIVDVVTLDKIMKDNKPSNKIQLKQCPWCKTGIRHSLRYGNSVKKITLVTNIVKSKIKREKLNTKKDIALNANRFQTSEKDLYDNAAKTLEGLVAVQRQLKILEVIRKFEVLVNRCLCSYYEYDMHRQLLKELEAFKKWILKRRIVFSKQEEFDAQNELKRLNLFINVHRYEESTKTKYLAVSRQLTNVCNTKISDELTEAFELAKQYISDGNPYTPDRQKKVEAVSKALTSIVGVSRKFKELATILGDIKEDEASVTAMKFSADHWLKCKQGHVFYVDVAAADVPCPKCSAKLRSATDTVVKNLVESVEKHEDDGSQKNGVDGTHTNDVDGTHTNDVDGTHKNEVDGTQKNDVDGTHTNDVDGTHKNEVDGTQKNDVDGTQNNDVDDTQKNEVDGTHTNEVDGTQKNHVDGTQKNNDDGTPQTNEAVIAQKNNVDGTETNKTLGIED